MAVQDRIDIKLFKTINRAVSFATGLDDMAHEFTQLLTGTLQIKGATLFILNPETDELEVLANFGLSIAYLNKGPILVKKSLDHKLRAEPVIIADVNSSDRLQYPEDAQKEGIRAIVSVPIKLSGKMIGVMRLYHHDPWEVSEGDIDSLLVLSENVALALMYSRLQSVLKSIKGHMETVHDVWLN